MLNPTDAHFKTAGLYDLKAGQGVPHEKDDGNFNGSILMLAMLEANIDFDENTPVLDIFRHEGCELREKGSAPPTSAKGPDNRRTNFLEALLNYSQEDADATALRQKILETWRFVGLAVACSEVWRFQGMP